MHGVPSQRTYSALHACLPRLPQRHNLHPLNDVGLLVFKGERSSVDVKCVAGPQLPLPGPQLLLLMVMLMPPVAAAASSLVTPARAPAQHAALCGARCCCRRSSSLLLL